MKYANWALAASILLNAVFITMVFKNNQTYDRPTGGFWLKYGRTFHAPLGFELYKVEGDESPGIAAGDSIHADIARVWYDKGYHIAYCYPDRITNKK